jgi:glucose-1-phosphate thymidylyltransferase
MHDSSVFRIIKDLEPSGREEFEITDVNNEYIRKSELTYAVLKGWWTDAGTPAGKLKASMLVGLAKGVTFHA